MRIPTAAALVVIASCVQRAPSLEVPPDGRRDPTRVDTVAIATMARALAADSLRGRGPWTAENERVARRLAAQLERLRARPLFGTSLLVPFTAAARPRDTVYNVVGVLPGRHSTTAGELVGITAHLDHLGIGEPDASGDSVHNGFLDAAVPMAMVLDVAARYARFPGDRPLAVMFFNLEEQGLLGARALVARHDAPPVLHRLRLLVGVDAGSPAGEAIEWQLMGALPEHPGARLADSLARARGWTTTSTAPRPISDVFMFSQHGVPILFPIPGAAWKGYSEAARAEAMGRFDHYHQPSDEWRADFPWVGTAAYADWLWTIVRGASESGMALE
jgi:Zn-dependent M28 family amino/carboxypeptidase